MNFAETLKSIEELIKGHKIQAARQILSAIPIGEIPGDYRGRFAQLARRCDDISRALRILNPNIYEVPKPTVPDLIEYASTIRRAGLVNQSLLILDRVPNSNEAHLHRAFAHITLCNYAKAKDHLELYLLAPGLKDSDRRVALTNLMAAYVTLGEYDSAEEIYRTHYAEFRREHRHLSVALDELLGQLYFFRGADQQCLETLNRIESENAGEQSALMFFVKKWRTLVLARMGKNDGSEVEFRKMARSEGHFEGLRQFDLFWALLKGDSNLLKYVFFGSPLSGFRAMIPAEISDESLITPAQKIPGEIIDAYDLSSFNLPFGLNLHRLCLLLLSDFYRPWTIERIHDTFYSHEVFDPVLSSKKIYQMILRLKRQIPNDSHLELVSTKNGYRMRPKKGIQLKVFRNMIFAHSTEIVEASLYQTFRSKHFTFSEIAKHLPGTKPQLRRHIYEMLDGGRLYRLSRSRFRLKKAA